MNTIEINISPKPAEEAATYINDLLGVNINKAILFLAAGGSATEVLSHINPEVLGNNLTVSVTDERYTDDIGSNNFAVLQSLSFYDDLIQVDAYCINTQLFGDETLEIHRARFEKNIREWQKDFPKGIIIALFGIGTDGHVGGIIPGVYSKEDFDKKFEGSEFVTAVDATGKNEHPLRVTTTFPFMRLIDYPVFYVRGEGKRDAIEKTLKTEGSLFETPARIIQEMKHPQLFTDIIGIERKE